MAAAATRGESSFARLPAFGAALYDRLVRSAAVERQTEEIARFLASHLGVGRLVDVGTGPGRLLAAVHRISPAVALHGLDISSAMVALARRNLAGTDAHLHFGTIEHTDFPDGYFDLVTCTGSFYLWERPEACLDEIWRILVPGGAAYLFETRRDHDARALRRAMRDNLRGEGLLYRFAAPVALRRQLRMAYRTGEVEAIVARTRFATSHALDPVSFAGLPIWLRITLDKRRGEP